MLAIIDAPIILGLLIFWLPLFVLPVWFLWRTFERAGLSGSIALLALIPFGLIIALGILAFAKWPNLRSAGPIA